MTFTDEHLKWLRGVAAAFAATTPEPFDDLFQVAAIGLLKALEKYDESRGNLKPYAEGKMTGEIRHYLRDKSYGRYPVIPASVNDKYNLVRNTHELALREGRKCSLDEVGIATQGAKAWAEIKQVMNLRQVPLSLDTPLEETLVAEIDEQNDAPLYEALAELPDEEAIAIRAFYFLGQSVVEIAQRLHVAEDVVQDRLDTGEAYLALKLKHVCD